METNNACKNILLWVLDLVVVKERAYSGPGAHEAGQARKEQSPIERVTSHYHTIMDSLLAHMSSKNVCGP